MRAVVVVHYRTPDLLERCLEQIGRTWTRRDGDRIVVVDNSAPLGGGDTDRVAGVDVERLCFGNVGYAGAVNLARRQLGCGSWVVMNPDVLPQPGCIDQLFEALASGVDVCGPALFWDEACSVHLPPSDPVDAPTLLLEGLAVGGLPRLYRHLRRRYRRHAHRHWTALEPLPSASLSGAMLAVSERAFAAAGPWDEGFRLYFEETDWLRRCRSAGRRLRYLPAARAVHLYDQSPAEADVDKQSRFAVSQRRFLRRYHRRIAALRDRLAEASPDRVAASPPERRAEPLEWVEWSPSPHGYPMVGRRGEHATLPEEILQRHPGLIVGARGVTESGREVELDL